jgi:hypothetical protein
MGTEITRLELPTQRTPAQRQNQHQSRDHQLRRWILRTDHQTKFCFEQREANFATGLVDFSQELTTMKTFESGSQGLSMSLTTSSRFAACSSASFLAIWLSR